MKQCYETMLSPVSIGYQPKGFVDVYEKYGIDKMGGK